MQAVLHTVLQGRTSQKYPGGQTSHSSLAVRLVLRVRVRVRVRVSVRVRVRELRAARWIASTRWSL